MRAFGPQSTSTAESGWAPGVLLSLPVCSLSLSSLFGWLVVRANQTAIIFCIPQLFKLIDALCFQTPGVLMVNALAVILYQLAATSQDIF